MKLAERKMFISESPFRDVDFYEERKQRRRPHILTFEEENRLLATATSHIRGLAVLILETVMRSRREALSPLGNDVDFANDLIGCANRKREPETALSPSQCKCKIELLSWRNLLGPESILNMELLQFYCSWRPRIVARLIGAHRRSRRSFDEFPLPSTVPGIISQAEPNSVGNGGMIVEQENVHAVRIGIRQIHFAQYLESLRRYLPGIRRKLMRNF
jgi:hypothetical protein